MEPILEEEGNVIVTNFNYDWDKSKKVLSKDDYSQWKVI